MELVNSGDLIRGSRYLSYQWSHQRILAGRGVGDTFHGESRLSPRERYRVADLLA